MQERFEYNKRMQEEAKQLRMAGIILYAETLLSSPMPEDLDEGMSILAAIEDAVDSKLILTEEERALFDHAQRRYELAASILAPLN